MDELPERQRRDTPGHRGRGQEQGYPPTVREIGAAVGLVLAGVGPEPSGGPRGKGLHPQGRLEAKGARAGRSGSPGRAAACRADRRYAACRWWGGWPPARRSSRRRTSRTTLDIPGFLGEAESCFALRVTGTSMINAGIFDGDIVVVKRQETADDGDIVVAVLDDEATLKRFFRERTR